MDRSIVAALVAGVSLLGNQALAADKDDEAPTCAAVDFLSGLELLSAGGVPSLKTNWLKAYTKPLVLSGEETIDSSHMKDETNFRSFAFSFATNTFTNENDPSRLQLLFRDTSLYNLYFNFVGARAAEVVPEKKAIEAGKTGLAETDTKKAVAAAKQDKLAEAKAAKVEGKLPSDCANPTLSRRLLATNRFYLSRDISAAKYQWFVSNGLGFRGVSAKADGGSHTGLGTFHLGFGVDGPLYTIGNKGDTGFASAEVYVSYNRTNRHGIEGLFGAGNGFSSFTTAGLEFELAVQEQLSLKLTYAKAVGGEGKSSLGDLVMARVAMKTK